MANIPPKSAGRPKGIPNKATTSAREAIAAFVDGNAHRLGTWLDSVATGVKDPAAGDKYLVKPDPARAFDMVMSVVEYHIPKLARTELTGKDGKDLRIVATNQDLAL